MTYLLGMRFVETTVFTRRVIELLDDDEYRALQNALALRPDGPPIIKGSGGLRKVRWARKGGGKSGGLRIIYFWDLPSDTCYMLFVYPKSDQEDLTPEQLKILRQVIQEEFHG